MKRISLAVAPLIVLLILSSPTVTQIPGLFPNERFVIRAAGQIHGAQATYQATYGSGSFGTLTQLANAGFIDAPLASGTKYGYSFVMTVVPYSPGIPSSFRLTATPVRYPKAGRRSFFIDTSGELHGADKNGEVANENDPYIESCALFGIADNERCTLADMRRLHGAEATYQATSGNGNFGSLAQLGALGLISSNLASGATYGYTYAVTTVAMQPGQSSATFKVTAVPTTYGVTGIRSFFIATDGVLHGADHQGLPATENDPPIGQ
jgi:hypothetical protein